MPSRSIERIPESLVGSLVLLAEDEPENRHLLRLLLGREGYEVAEAATGLEAIQATLEKQPALVLLDVGLPEMDGFDVCRQLKSNPRTAAIPVIFLTAMAGSSDIVRGFQVGGVDYITKPFQSAELLARVRTHVQLHQLQQVLSVCSYCGKIRNDSAEWEPVETYIKHKTGADLSHGVCPDCYNEIRGQFSSRRDDI
jgi:DNA-binding response OmpR family regulator